MQRVHYVTGTIAFVAADYQALLSSGAQIISTNLTLDATKGVYTFLVAYTSA
ncbi:hypothetical protein [Segetibacter aerophilus]|uniref:Uncharacterized protein n=1 Tax=Segetibacter aerophilus TaxID=670293 RepID=A0A512B9R8_9BACT|nr:hypothetical protein [Segetibacter aerophilus]GEO08708.1 hypothetical protein SAE01_12040 [Segetibacter aerophilus]